MAALLEHIRQQCGVASLTITRRAPTSTRQGRPRGKRFGTLVHAILAEVELDAEDAGVSVVAAAQGRILGASAEEIYMKAISAATGEPSRGVLLSV